MAKATFLAFNGRSVVSSLIRYFTRSKKYSHIAYLTSHEDLIECWPSRQNPWNRWDYSSLDNHKPGTHYELWELEVTDDCLDRLDSYFYTVAARRTKYDWLGVVGFVLRLVRESKTRLFCSEGCTVPLKKELCWSSVTPSHVSPQGFVELIQVAGAQKVYDTAQESSFAEAVT